MLYPPGPLSHVCTIHTLGLKIPLCPLPNEPLGHSSAFPLSRKVTSEQFGHPSTRHPGCSFPSYLQKQSQDSAEELSHLPRGIQSKHCYHALLLAQLLLNSGLHHLRPTANSGEAFCCPKSDTIGKRLL